MPGADHAFVVLNRKPGSNKKDYKTWGEDAIVIDAWSNQVYPAMSIPKKLKGVQIKAVRVDNNLYKSEHKLIKFDPKKHELIPIEGMSLENYKDWCKAQFIATKLKEVPSYTPSDEELFGYANHK